MDRNKPFQNAVVRAMRNLYPEELADKSFDNTGLLLEAPHVDGRIRNKVLLTIDLTKAVAEEAITKGASIIIAYHPIIFRPLKSLTLKNTQQSSLLRLAAAGISVYSPHTAVDAAPKGLNDWLADVITGTSSTQSDIDHERKVITPVSINKPGFEAAGYGRILSFQKPQKLSTLVRNVSSGLNMKSIHVAVPQSTPDDNKANLEIKSVGICAGSGGNMLGSLDVDMLFTGEMSHHEALAAIEKGQVVLTVSHSNSERGFLRIMKDILYRELHRDIQLWRGSGPEQLDVVISSKDRDPYEVVSEGDKGW